MALRESEAFQDGDVQAAARRARRALGPFLMSPSVVLDLSKTSTLADDSVGLGSTEVYLVDSPYEQRRPVIAFVPYDKPADGDESHPSRAGYDEDMKGTPIDLLVQPGKLPHGLEEGGMVGENNGTSPVRTHWDDSQPQLRIAARTPEGPYGRLSYVIDESCTPFTALLATLRAAGFTRISGRAALLHKTHSLLWVKHLLPSMVDQLLQRPSGAYRKANHFPGTHVLGRKDKLCLLLRRAGLRWQASGERAMTPCDADTTSEEAARAVAWASLTPESWLLPQDAEACMHAVRKPNPSGETVPLFIVKPTNQAGGQGIFLISGGSETGVTALKAAIGGVGSSLGNVSRHGKRSASLVGSSGPLDTTERTRNGNNYVVQRYIANPFLLEGRKFDLRLYVVVTSYDPVRLYLYREGLVRIASVPYTRTGGTAWESGVTDIADVTDLRAHLTNFTLNKEASPVSTREHGAGATAAGEYDMKWPLSSLAIYLARMGYDWPGTLQRIHELLRLVFLSVTPEVRAALRASSARRLQKPDSDETRSVLSSHATVNGTSPFFEIFGVDVLLAVEGKSSERAHDLLPAPTSVRTLRPILLEVNIMPSLSTHYSLLDQRIKANFIADALTLVGLMPPPYKVMSSATRAPRTATDRKISYGDAFLDALSDSEIRNVCLATEEEHRRANNFVRLLPTRDSASKYAALMRTTEEMGTPAATPPPLDAVLSAWLASSPSKQP